MVVNLFIKDSKKEKTSVYAVVRYKGQRYKITAGVTVEARYWNADKRRVSEDKRYTDAAFVNLRLELFTNQVSNYFAQCRISKIVPTPQQVRAAISDVAPPPQTNEQLFIPYYTNFYMSKNYSVTTVKNYNNTLNFLKLWERETGQPLRFEAMDVHFFEAFIAWVTAQKYTRQLNGKKEARYYSLNYIGTIIKCMRTVMRESGPEGRDKLHNNLDYRTRFIKRRQETADTVYLSDYELRQIHAFTPTAENIAEVIKTTDPRQREMKVRALITAKNKFLIGAYTALRISDFNRLSEVNVKQNYIRIKPKKGTRKNDDVIIPIHPIIKEIIASGFDIATRVSEQKINEHIKEVCRLVGINEQTSVTRTEGGRQVERIYPKYQLISSHTARRSGATNMALAGIDYTIIMQITNHSTPASLIKYLKISREQTARKLAEHPFFNG